VLGTRKGAFRFYPVRELCLLVFIAAGCFGGGGANSLAILKLHAI
jgi:hypothetical protein